MSYLTAPSLINWLIENLESAQDTEYVDLTEIMTKYKAKAAGQGCCFRLSLFILGTHHFPLIRTFQLLLLFKTISRRTLLPFTMSSVKYPIVMLTKYKVKAAGFSVGNCLIFFASYVKVEQGRAKHDWTRRTKRYYVITWLEVALTPPPSFLLK
jgi:hypothetical protein